MSIESKYIINQINQAPEDFKVDESSYILDKIRKGIVDSTRLRVFGKDISGRQFLPKSEGDIMNFALKRYGEGDIGYSIGSLMVAADRDLINPNMSVKEVDQIMEREGLSPYGFKLSKALLNVVFNPYTKDLPQGNTIGAGDFR